MQIQSVRFITKPTATWVGNLLKIIEEFLSSPDPPAALWRRLLGHLSSLTLLVKGGMLRMRSLQIRLRSRWDFRDELLRIPWDLRCQEDLLWWSWVTQQREGVDLSLPLPDLSFYSDESDIGWGAIVGVQQVSGVWTPSQRELSINLREMMAVQEGLLEFNSLLRGNTIALFCDNVTTVAYLRRSGGTRSQVLFLKARNRGIYRCPVEMHRPKVGIAPLMFPCLLWEFFAYIVLLSNPVPRLLPLVTHGFLLSSRSSSHPHARAWTERWVGAGSMSPSPCDWLPWAYGTRNSHKVFWQVTSRSPPSSRGVCSFIWKVSICWNK